MKSLRDKVSAELFMEQNKWARPQSGGKSTSSAKKTRRGGKTANPAKDGKAPAKDEKTEKAPPAEPAAASASFTEQLDQLKGTKNARLYAGEEIANEVPISGLQEVLESSKNNGVNTLIMDGIITQRLIELAPKAGIKTIVAENQGPLPRDPVGISIFTRETLS